VVLIRLVDPEEHFTSIIRVKRISKLVFGISSQRASDPSYCYVFSSSLIFVTLMMVAMRSPEVSVPTRATRHHMPEDEFFICLISPFMLERHYLWLMKGASYYNQDHFLSSY
jgi:hypothetical protein